MQWALPNPVSLLFFIELAKYLFLQPNVQKEATDNYNFA